jgi:hypothetical protein
MKLQTILTEVPLPADWDQSAYTKDKSFAFRVKYATARAKKLGAGSSRVAFEIEYEGRPTILKIAKNKKGMAQNEFEIRTLNDHYIKKLGITIPMIDSDVIDEDNPTWLHTEKADKMTKNKFKAYMGGVDINHLIVFIEWSVGNLRSPPDNMTVEEASELLDNNETLSGLMDFVGSGYDIALGDLDNLTNWGIYQDSPVLIDVGGSSEIIKKYYMNHWK